MIGRKVKFAHNRRECWGHVKDIMVCPCCRTLLYLVQRGKTGSEYWMRKDKIKINEMD